MIFFRLMAVGPGSGHGKGSGSSTGMHALRTNGMFILARLRDLPVLLLGPWLLVWETAAHGGDLRRQAL